MTPLAAGVIAFCWGLLLGAVLAYRLVAPAPRPPTVYGEVEADSGDELVHQELWDQAWTNGGSAR